jgi:hypothetical protein
MVGAVLVPVSIIAIGVMVWSMSVLPPDAEGRYPGPLSFWGPVVIVGFTVSAVFGVALIVRGRLRK